MSEAVPFEIESTGGISYVARCAAEYLARAELNPLQKSSSDNGAVLRSEVLRDTRAFVGLFNDDERVDTVLVVVKTGSTSYRLRKVYADSLASGLRPNQFETYCRARVPHEVIEQIRAYLSGNDALIEDGQLGYAELRQYNQDNHGRKSEKIGPLVKLCFVPYDASLSRPYSKRSSLSFELFEESFIDRNNGRLQINSYSNWCYTVTLDDKATSMATVETHKPSATSYQGEISRIIPLGGGPVSELPRLRKENRVLVADEAIIDRMLLWHVDPKFVKTIMRNAA